jgi:hypothetical protein
VEACAQEERGGVRHGRQGHLESPDSGGEARRWAKFRREIPSVWEHLGRERKREAREGSLRSTARGRRACAGHWLEVEETSAR